MNGPVSFSNYQLNEALFHTVDITDRCLLPFMLLGETARSIAQDNELKGDGIYIGAEEKYITEGVKSTLRTIASNVDVRLGVQDFVEDETGFHWVYRGIPISIKIIKHKYPVIQNPDFTWYMAEEYKIPNPFAKYWEIRNLIK